MRLLEASNQEKVHVRAAVDDLLERTHAAVEHSLLKCALEGIYERVMAIIIIIIIPNSALEYYNENIEIDKCKFFQVATMTVGQSCAA